LIEYITSVHWRVAKRLSYIEDAGCLKVKQIISMNYKPHTKHINKKYEKIKGFWVFSVVCPLLRYHWALNGYYA